LRYTRALPWLACVFAAACATQQESPSATPRAATDIAAPAPASASPVFEAPAERPAIAQAVKPAPLEPSRPLDATRLPEFDGERQVVREPLRGVARIDLTAPPDDLWQRIRNGFSMPNLETPLVAEKTAWYAARPDYLKRMFERSRRYLHHIVEELERRGMPTELALLPMVESSFNPLAYSRAHASGLWQFIPGTGKRYELTQNWWFDGRRDIVASTAAALDYLNDVYEMHGDWHLALASYNWGENAVARAVAKNRAAGLATDYESLTMPAETRHYVPKLQAIKNIIANPRPFGIELDPIPNQPYFTTITKTRDIDVELAARLAEMPVEEFMALNPGFSRPFIPVSVSSRIVLPADKVEVFRANLQKHDDKKLVSWQAYQPRKGDTIESIAKKFGMTVGQLREVNGITPRTRGVPSMLVVSMNGTGTENKRLPIMYAPPIPVSSPRTRTHTVKLGETLVGIAQRYQVSVDDLRRWNKIGRIAAGQTLTIQPQARPPLKKGRATEPPKGKPRTTKPAKPVKRS
jgi:membrane-bound lytic murein transglycosylase D